MRIWSCAPLLLALASVAPARELHVSPRGADSNDGSVSKPLLTISAAARMAMPGDTVTVHEGTYRERVTPPRGGDSDDRRIVYRAAPGEKAVIKGSEVIRDWKRFAPGVWKAVVPNSLFGAYNPYKDLIVGDWFTDKGRPHHTGEVYLNGESLWETHLIERVLSPLAPASRTWFAEVDDKYTYLYANFGDKDPNAELVEINVRDSCFYPDKPGRNYITVQGFRMMHAATQWAAPTAEQIGLVGTHWSKGWIIEDNVISDSKCVGISLGKDRATGHNVWINDRSKDGAIHYVEVIERALKAGWSRETIGSHVVRRNTIFNCEQAGIVGSLGAVFSRLESNHIYDVWKKRQFTGAEMGGIKLHAAIDVLIRGNRVHGCGRGLWMDWMAQGTRITGNVLYDNDTDDLFVEVNHGPFVVDNNIMLSPINVRDWSQSGAYVHNLMTGTIVSRPELKRRTPWHPAHATTVSGLHNIPGGDSRYFNNVFAGGGLSVYDEREYPLFTGNNVYHGQTQPYKTEAQPKRGGALKARIVNAEDGTYLELTGALTDAAVPAVTSDTLGKTKISGLPFENYDGTPLSFDTDYFGKKRQRVIPGPFATPQTRLKVW